MKNLLAFKKHALLLATLTVTITTALSSQAVFANQTLNIGYQKASGLLSIIKSQGVLEEAFADQDIEINWREFAAGPQLLEALNAGSVDLGYTGSPPPIFAQSAGIELRYVAATQSLPNGEAIVVPEDSSIQTVEDLAGKRIGVQRGSSANYLLVAALDAAGLEFSDVTAAYLTPADARGAFVNNNIDAWSVWDPYLTSAEFDLNARVLVDYANLNQAFGFYQASASFVEENPELLQQLLDALQEGSTWISENHDETVALLAQELGLSSEIVDAWQAKTDYTLLPLNNEVIANRSE
ncbi:unnamed protein product, partial [Ectocarpus sp. 12 AP-2014]